jgi:hypothetical protein
MLGLPLNRRMHRVPYRDPGRAGSARTAQRRFLRPARARILTVAGMLMVLASLLLSDLLDGGSGQLLALRGDAKPMHCEGGGVSPNENRRAPDGPAKRPPGRCTHGRAVSHSGTDGLRTLRWREMGFELPVPLSRRAVPGSAAGDFAPSTRHRATTQLALSGQSDAEAGGRPRPARL